MKKATKVADLFCKLWSRFKTSSYTPQFKHQCGIQVMQIFNSQLLLKDHLPSKLCEWLDRYLLSWKNYSAIQKEI